MCWNHCVHFTLYVYLRAFSGAWELGRIVTNERRGKQETTVWEFGNKGRGCLCNTIGRGKREEAPVCLQWLQRVFSRVLLNLKPKLLSTSDKVESFGWTVWMEATAQEKTRDIPEKWGGQNTFWSHCKKKWNGDYNNAGPRNVSAGLPPSRHRQT